MKNKITGNIIQLITALCTLLIIAIIVYLLTEIVIGGKNYISWEFLTQAPSDGMTGGGIFPAIVGTFLLVIIMSIIGVPIGTITAIYLNEYASKRQSFFTKLIRFAVNTLAGVPSIVFGLFGLGFFIQFIGSGIDKTFSGGQLHWGQPNLLWASMTMAFLTIPVVIVSVEEALKNVPDELRAGSLALGATKWQTIRKIVIPNSISGIMTGTVLAVSRGAGEVAPILFTGAAYFLPKLPHSLTDQFMNLGYHVYIMSTQSTDVEATKGIQYATVLVLLAVTFSLSLIAVIIRYRHRMKINK
jgi:phosphate transport system permease protein